MRVALLYVHNTPDAQDVMNRALLKVFTQIDAFKGDHTNFGGWVRRIIINEALDRLRSRKSFNQVHEVQEVPEVLAHSFELNEDPSAILQLLEQLPIKASTVFSLYVIDGYTHKEIADKTGMTVANSKWNLHQARKMLKEMIVQKELI